jgi:coenzyme PQQ synthesis protein D (PqqD)
MDQTQRAVDVLLASIPATMAKRLAHSAQDVPIDGSAIQIPHAGDAAHGSEYTGRAAPARPRMTLTESATLCADPDVLATTFGNEVVLLNLRDGIYYGLEDVGALIWSMLARPVTVRDICAAVCAQYDVDAHRCERDVLEIVGDLTKCGLIQVRSDA